MQATVTVSRYGMVYLEPTQLRWQPLVASWIAALPECADGVAAHGAFLQGLLESLLPPLLPVPVALVSRTLMTMISACAFKHLAWCDYFMQCVVCLPA